MKCPCHSGEEYKNCCNSSHKGAFPQTAKALMRSHYSAYAMGNSDYILSTTHPKHEDQAVPVEERKTQIENFSKYTHLTQMMARGNPSELS